MRFHWASVRSLGYAGVLMPVILAKTQETGYPDGLPAPSTPLFQGKHFQTDSKTRSPLPICVYLCSSVAISLRTAVTTASHGHFGRSVAGRPAPASLIGRAPGAPLGLSSGLRKSQSSRRAPAGR